MALRVECSGICDVPQKSHVHALHRGRVFLYHPPRPVVKENQHFHVGPDQKWRLHVLKQITFILSLAVAASANSAVAASFSGLCDTGVTAGCATQTPLTANAVDTNFTVTITPSVGTPPFASRTIASNPGYFTSGGNGIGTATASWITTATGTTPVDATAVGTYNYQEAILATTTGLVTISGDWAADNCGTIAGAPLPLPSPAVPGQR